MAAPPPLTLPQPPFLPITEPLWVSSCYMSACLAVFIWDYILTLPAEVHFYRTRGMTPATIPFVLCRYIGLLGLVVIVVAATAFFTEPGCQKYGAMAPYINNIITLASSAIFVLRTWGIYGKDKRALVVLTILFLGQAAATLTVSYYVVPVLGFGGLGCIPQSDPKHPVYNLYYVFNMIFDTCIVAMSSFRLVRRTGGEHATTLYHRLLKDGVLYFVAVLAINVLNTVFFSFQDWPFMAVNAPFGALVTSVMSCRLVLRPYLSGTPSSSTSDPLVRGIASRSNETSNPSRGPGISAVASGMSAGDFDLESRPTPFASVAHKQRPSVSSRPEEILRASDGGPPWSRLPSTSHPFHNTSGSAPIAMHPLLPSHSRPAKEAASYSMPGSNSTFSSYRPEGDRASSNGATPIQVHVSKEVVVDGSDPDDDSPPLLRDRGGQRPYGSAGGVLGDTSGAYRPQAF